MTGSGWEAISDGFSSDWLGWGSWNEKEAELRLMVWVYSGSSSYTMEELQAGATEAVRQVLTNNPLSFGLGEKTKTFKAANGIDVNMYLTSYST
jgi:hypothetical protein